MSTLGPLVSADETLNHQITDTFATVGEADRSWTEKIWAQACAQDGSLQIGLGLGKYTNRNVMDAFVAVSRGVEQWTVRASRELTPDRERPSVGPIHYEVLEPLRRVRFALDANDVAPVRFEWIFEGRIPAHLENREQHRSRDGARLDADVVRYHQTGTASGWAEIDGRRVKIDDATWVSTRDHSWGVRYSVGAPVPDVAPRTAPPGLTTYTLWSPILCERPGGRRYGLFWYYLRIGWSGGPPRVEFQGAVEHPDGSREPFLSLVPELRFRDDNRRFLGGVLRFVTGDGRERPVTVTPVSETGLHLGPGLYHGFHGRWHGQWRGKIEVDGEHYPDCSDPSVAREIHQHRDCVVRVEDPVGGGVGWGSLQSIVTGAHPEIGLTEEASFY